MTPQEARARFSAARVARLATITAEGTPRLVPVTFAVLPSAGQPDAGTGVTMRTRSAPDAPSENGAYLAEPEGTIVTAVDHKPKRTTRLRRLDDIAREPRVTLLADEYDDDWTRLWWARADGVARIVEPADQLHASVVRALADRYRQYREHPPAGPAILISVTRWSGWAYTG